LKELMTELVERGLHSGGPVSRQRSPLPVARRATGIAVPAMSNAELAQVQDDEDASHYAQPSA